MTYGVDGPWWTAAPAYRVSQLTGVDPQLLDLALDPLPADAPAVLRFTPVTGVRAAGQVATLLDAADRAAVALFPRWLPGADQLDGPGALGRAAVRALAARLAARSRGFGPFLTDLAERALDDATGDRRTDAGARFPAEVRAAGLVRVLADACQRRSVVLLVRVPERLTPADEQALTAAAEWFVQHGRCSVWLAGAALRSVDRVRTVRVTLPEPLTRLTREAPAPEGAGPGVAPPADRRRQPAGGKPYPPGSPAPTDSAPLPTLRVPPRSGVPRADSAAEQALERALARRRWAYGRRWNHTLTWHTLARPYRLDLFWPVEGLVVEVDGPEHRERLRYADDRHRDAQLQLLGHDVLRFTNDQVLSDVEAVVGTIRDLLAARRTAGARKEETRHHADR